MYKITIKVDGQTIVLSTEDSVRRAMQRGDLRRDSRVIVEDNDREDFVGIAENFRWLKHQFNELDGPVEGAIVEHSEEPEATQAASVQPIVPDPGVGSPELLTEPNDEAARLEITQSEFSALPQLSSQPKVKSGGNSGGWILLAVAVIGGIIWLASRPAGDDYVSPAAETYEEAALEPEAPVYPVIPTSHMHAFPDNLVGTEIYQVGDLVVQLGSAQRDGETVASVYITDGEGTMFSMASVGSLLGARFGVGDLDGDGVANDLILTGYSRGAHCCTDVQVATRVNGTWKAVDFGTWDGDGLGEFPTDLGGDKAPEFRMYDPSFLYTFDSYAASVSPVQILKLRNGSAVDVSADRAYRQVHINRMAELEPMCREGSNSGCAAYVASAARAQTMSPAWAVMLESYRNTDWGLPSACLIQTDEACPASMTVNFDSYPEALQYFLGEQGFSSKVYVRAKTWDGRAAFDCNGEGLNDVLRTVCGSGYLQLADHRMAVAYTKALAFSRDRIGLQRRQQEWINQRNALPADLNLISESYRQRADQLAAGQG